MTPSEADERESAVDVGLFPLELINGTPDGMRILSDASLLDQYVALRVQNDWRTNEAFAACETECLSRMTHGVPREDVGAPLEFEDAPFIWKIWTGSGRIVSEIAMMRAGVCHGYVWRLVKGGWAFGVEQNKSLAETRTLLEAKSGLLTLARKQLGAALTKSSEEAQV